MARDFCPGSRKGEGLSQHKEPLRYRKSYGPACLWQAQRISGEQAEQATPYTHRRDRRVRREQQREREGEEMKVERGGTINYGRRGSQEGPHERNVVASFV